MEDSMGHEQKGYMTPKDAESDAWFARLHLLLLFAQSYSGHE
jgi:hypothetical protein